jgi:hypothetical protein
MSDEWCNGSGAYAPAQVGSVTNEGYGKAQCPECVRVFPKLPPRVKDMMCYIPQHRAEEEREQLPEIDRTQWKTWASIDPESNGLLCAGKHKPCGETFHWKSIKDRALGTGQHQEVCTGEPDGQ